MSFWDKEQHVITVDKNSKEKIVVNLCENKDKKFVDIRIHYDMDGEWKPSSKGVAIPEDKFSVIVAAILEANSNQPKDTTE